MSERTRLDVQAAHLGRIMAASPAEQRRYLCELFDRLNTNRRSSVLTMALVCASAEQEAPPPQTQPQPLRVLAFPVSKASGETAAIIAAIRRLATVRPDVISDLKAMANRMLSEVDQESVPC